MADAAQSYPSSGQANYEAGLRSARYTAGIGALESLFDQHFASFGYATDHFKRLTLQGLRDKINWQAAVDSLTRAVALDPGMVLWQHELASVLEQIGKIEDALMVRHAITRLEPESIENNDGLGRLYERAKSGDKDAQASFAEKHYARVSKSISHYLLMISRYAAMRGPQALKTTTLEKLKVRVRDALTFSPNDIALSLAMGFVHLAEKDRNAARRMFLAASLLMDQPTLIADNCDRWSVAYAQAFLLGLIRADAPPPAAFLTVDPINLLLVRASLLREQGAIYFALSEYSTAVSRLLPLRLPSTFHVYRGYKIVSHEGLFYAVPESVVDFSILRRTVVRRPAFLKETAPRLQSTFAARLETFLRFTQRRIAAQIARIPGVWPAALTIYIRRFAVAGVLTDIDVSLLHERIDGSEHDPRPETERVATRDPIATG